MLYQNPDSESMIIVIILIIAVFILVILLIATFALLRSEAKTKNNIESKNEVKTSLPVAVLDTFSEDEPIKDDVPKNELKSSSLVGVFARLFPEDRLKNALRSSQKSISDSLPKVIKTLNWTMCFILATFISILNFFRGQYIMGPSSMRTYFVCLAIISPICLAVAWLRLTGVKWRQALLLFIYVPVAFLALMFIFAFLGSS